MNIISNAVDSIQHDGRIIISTSQIDEFAVVAIEDTGSGIPQEVRSKIYDPFFTTKEIGKGVGLGLSITYAIIEEHQGTIEFESEVGKGTKFIITLPLLRKP